MKSTRIRVAFVCLLLVVSSASAQIKTDASQYVSSMLEIKCSSPQGAISLTMRDLLGAMEESESWSDEALDAARKASPRGRLFVDLVIVPMRRFTGLFGRTLDDPRLTSKYIARLEKTYCELRDIYAGKQGVRYAKSPITDELLYAITDMAKEDKKALTKSLIRDAAKEYSAMLDKIDEIVFTEDVYAHIEHFKLLWYYINRAEVHAMVESVFPFLNSIQTDEDLVTLKKQYEVALARHSLYVENGRLYSRN